MRPPTFKTQTEADEWLDRVGLFREAIAGKTQQWHAEDDSIIGYNTASLPRGGFCSFRFKLHGDDPELLFVKHHAMRRAARQRAVVLYRKYSPKFARKYPNFA